MKKILIVLFLVFLFCAPVKTFAREGVDYWYVKDFKSDIVVNSDSSIVVTEDIVADCGVAQKHGIYRTFPTFRSTNEGKINLPITLESITDFNGDPINYSETKNLKDKTITWKIGNADKFVSGANNYRIKYQVKNTILNNSADFDEFYWNLSGNFWDLDIDNFSATIIFPAGITKDNSTIFLYSGKFSSSSSDSVKYDWPKDNQLQVLQPKTILTDEGITLSITFPKNIVTPYTLTFWEKYGSYFFFLIPLIILIICFLFWRKFGQDPKINPTIAPEFEIPENLAPIEIGLVYTDSILKNNFISASIINLAVNKFLKIEKIGKKDYKLTKLKNKYQPSKAEKKLIFGLFTSGGNVLISELKNKFYAQLPEISAAGNDYLIAKKWLKKYSRLPQYLFIFFSLAFFVSSFAGYALNFFFGLSVTFSAMIILIFSFLMPRRTKEGALLQRRILGLKLYMDTAEKYRQQFNEKENIFEKFLPYAIVFGIAKEWAKKIAEIYGEEYFNHYHPVWFIGPSFTNFNIDSMISEITSMSSNMASTISSSPSSSGSSGGGFSGGGGGGGGGGGW